MNFDKEKINEEIIRVNIKATDDSYRSCLDYKPYYEFKLSKQGELIPCFYSEICGDELSNEEYKNNEICLVFSTDYDAFDPVKLIFNNGIDEKTTEEIKKIIDDAQNYFLTYDENFLCKCERCNNRIDSENYFDEDLENYFKSIGQCFYCPDCAKEVKQNNLEQNIENFKRFYINAMQEAHEQLISDSNKYIINPAYNNAIQNWLNIELEATLDKYKKDFENYGGISFYAVDPEQQTEIVIDKFKNCIMRYSIDPDINGTWNLEQLADEGFYIRKN